MKLSRFIASVLIGSSLTLMRCTAAAGTPTIDSILARHVEAMGGKEAMEKVRSRLIRFRVESSILGDSEGEAFAQAPDRLRSHVDMGAAGSMDEGFDGTVAWAKNPWQGVRVKTGDELAKVKRDARFDREFKLKSIYPDLAYKGTEKVGDEDAWVLESRPSPTSKENFWFSTKTGLGLRQDSEFQGPMGVVKVNALPRDYRTFDGLKYPGAMKLKVSSAGQEFEMTMEFLSVKHNVAIDATKFAKPAE